MPRSHHQKKIRKVLVRPARRLSLRGIILAFIAGVAAGCACLAIMRPDAAVKDFLGRGEAFYAELATTSDQGVPLAATSTLVHVPIVVYHIVRPAYPDDSAGVRGLAQTPEVFDAQMAYLREAGYTVIPFRTLEDHFDKGAPLPEKPIIITLDDGWHNQFEYALPILREYGYPATFFVFTNAIGRPGFFSWRELRTLRDSGMTIGSHSISHPYLTQMPLAGEKREIFDSKKELELRLGISVDEFAYPFGQYNPSIVSLVKEAGYRGARGDYVSGDQSPDSRFTMSALNAPTSLAGFKRAFP